MTIVKIDIFQAKKHQNFNFELQKSYIPQKKAENIYNTDSARKSKIFAKYLIFSDFQDMLEYPKNPKTALVGPIKYC